MLKKKPIILILVCLFAFILLTTLVYGTGEESPGDVDDRENVTFIDFSGRIIYSDAEEFNIEDIELKLYSNGEPLDKTAEITIEQDGSYLFSFYDLPVADIDGLKFLYTIFAATPDGYEIAYENVSPYQGETGYAYDGCTIFVSYSGDVQLFSFEGFNFEWEDGIFTVVDYLDFEAGINWNDNSEQDRPGPVIGLYFKIPGLGMESFDLLTIEILKSWGVFDESLLVMPDPDKEIYNIWKYLYSALPALLEGEAPEPGDDDDEDGEAPPRYPIEYSFKIINEEEIEEGYLIETVSDAVIMLTKKTDATFEKLWKDRNNWYKTRPTVETLQENLTLYSTVDGKTDTIGTLDSLEYSLINGTETSAWSIQISELPMYNPLGHPYIYYLAETGDSLAIKEGSDFEGESNVSYTAKYENHGNYIEQTNYCYPGGSITNTLTDIADFEVTKLWQDGGIGVRPDGNLYLYRYPNLPGMDYTTASPVLGMQLPLDTVNDIYKIDFSELPSFPAGGLPRFDSEGNEYVYFIQEILSGGAAGNYTRFNDYTNADPPPTGGNINALFNGGILQNRRTGTISIPVTKTWKAAAQQDMNSEVELLVERRQKGTGDLFEPVTSIGNNNGIYVLDGFRAEVMELTHTFAGLDQFDENGLEYEYRVTEYAITIDDERKVVAGIVPDENGNKFCVINNVAYELSTSINTTSGAVTLTNSLVGETEVRVRKVWNGFRSEDYPWTMVTINVFRDGVRVNPSDAGTITIGETTKSDFTIDVNNAWRRDTPGDSPTQSGEWLIISGLPRYDDRGREYKYTVTENSVSGYSVSYSTLRPEPELQ